MLDHLASGASPTSSTQLSNASTVHVPYEILANTHNKLIYYSEMEKHKQMLLPKLKHRKNRWLEKEIKIITNICLHPV